MTRVSLIDTTLLESGRISEGSFTVRQRLIIARSLDFLGIGAIELGHPGISRETDEFITEAGDDRLKAELIVLARVREQAVEAALETGVGRINVCLGKAGLQEQEGSGKSQDQVCGLIEDSVRKITASGRKVSLTIEDATRANMNFLIGLCQAAVEGGADFISLGDIAGTATPDEMRSIFLCVRSVIPEVSLGAQCHNHLGFAVENALAAMEGGADGLYVTVNRSGPGAGITPLRNLAVALKVQYGIDTVDMRSVDEISRMVSRFSGASTQEDRPGRETQSHDPSHSEAKNFPGKPVCEGGWLL